MHTHFNGNFYNTDTYLSTFSNKDDYETKDKILQKAIRYNPYYFPDKIMHK